MKTFPRRSSANTRRFRPVSQDVSRITMYRWCTNMFLLLGNAFVAVTDDGIQRVFGVPRRSVYYLMDRVLFSLVWGPVISLALAHEL
jgi:hypothetical protein